MTALEHALDYARRGWRPLPVPFKSKAPVIPEWQKSALGADDLDRHFNGHPANIGVLLGAPSGGLVDVDLDAPEAVALASRFLPATESRFGRASKRRSHWLYVADPVPSPEKFEDTTGDAPACLVELRADGQQTIFPGSVHTSGELVEWDEDGERARGDGATLRRAVAELASACVLARHWPAEGARHETALAAAGLLAHGGADVAPAVRIIAAAAKYAGADEHRADIIDTFDKYQRGEPVTGGPRLADALRGDGAKVVTLLRKWLGLASAESDEHLTDVTNAAHFVAAHRDTLRYCYAWRSWLAWDDRRWRRDAGDIAMRCAKVTAHTWWPRVAAAPEGVRKALAKHAHYAESVRGLEGMLRLAQSEMAIRPDDLDRDPWLLNCPNGTLELRTGHVRPHRREDYLTKLTAAEYHADARHETWDRFLEGALPDPDARAYAQRFAGYALTGLTREEVFVFCLGPTGGGKSTFVESLRQTWHDYATSADFSTFLAKKLSDGPREDIARLAGARLVTSVETRDGQRLAEGLIKLLTGGDTVPARRLYERTFEYLPQFKLLLAANDRPRTSARDEALWRRLRELPFPTSRPKRGDRDDTVKATLTDPGQAGAAILAWSVEGCAQWLEHGLGEPDVVMTATTAYRRSQEPLADFLEECCRLHPDVEVPIEKLRQEYERWCRETGVKHPIGGKRWGDALKARGCQPRRTEDARYWTGIDLRKPSDDVSESGSRDGA